MSDSHKVVLFVEAALVLAIGVVLIGIFA